MASAQARAGGGAAWEGDGEDAARRMAAARVDLRPVRRTRAGLSRYFDAEGMLLAEAIVFLVRRVWWADEEHAEVRRRPDAWRCKVAPLLLWYAPERWPAWWPAGTWVDVGDRLQACTERGEAGQGELWVRRALL